MENAEIVGFCDKELEKAKKFGDEKINPCEEICRKKNVWEEKAWIFSNGVNPLASEVGGYELKMSNILWTASINNYKQL